MPRIIKLITKEATFKDEIKVLLDLRDSITGVYATTKSYFVAEENPEDFEAFDAQFPAKQKLKLPGQQA